MKIEFKKRKNGLWQATAKAELSCTSSERKSKYEAEAEARAGVMKMLSEDLRKTIPESEYRPTVH